MKKKCFHVLLLLLLLTGCGVQQSGPTYDELKKMVTDALQTEDGKKAVKQMLADPEFKELLILDQPEVKKSIEDTLLSKKGEDFWKKTFEDPKFTETIAKSMKEQQQDIMKLLMDDSSFQKEMEEFFGQPDMQKQLETVMQSGNMKKHLEKVVEETISSPLLQTKWQELILKAGEVKPVESEGGGGKKPDESKGSGGGK
ncbi:spore germination lipoprotein GerD [Sporosarcina sp. YIM B06819]|uniref:spore germination lipoprotein GerD n=1 Tax=Sporosarcina sp. YIM B06819 TaxID=3081769 RepID=UPI00298CFB1D|nr:spore germination lipoprotein GerD [Sporosarcina sp. YIM B06819]